MKKYKMTNRGKIFLTGSFILIVASYFLMPLVFYMLRGLLLILVAMEVIHYIMNCLKKYLMPKDELIDDEGFKEAVKEALVESSADDTDNNRDTAESEIEHTLEDGINEAEETLTKDARNEYKTVVEDYEIIEEDMKSIEKDLEEIGKRVAVHETSGLEKSAIGNYYSNKKIEISESLTDKINEKNIEIYDETSLIDTIIESLKDYLSFKKYRVGELVLHHYFGIGKIISTEEELKVSFINDQLEEIIEFEYDKNNKIPEINLFKAPKDEDERQYYYSYQRDIPESLTHTIEKIQLNFPDIKCHWNIFLRSEKIGESYEFIAISDKLHVFSKNKDEVNNQLLKNLVEDLEIDIKCHEITDYMSVNSILLKSKVKGIMSREKIALIDERIANNNIKDFNERAVYKFN